jgi:hypothetical protein
MWARSGPSAWERCRVPDPVPARFAVPGLARAFHATVPGYRPTPLVGLPGLAA